MSEYSFYYGVAFALWAVLFLIAGVLIGAGFMLSWVLT